MSYVLCLLLQGCMRLKTSLRRTPHFNLSPFRQLTHIETLEFGKDHMASVSTATNCRVHLVRSENMHFDVFFSEVLFVALHISHPYIRPPSRFEEIQLKMFSSKGQSVSSYSLA